jgi:hypothetical protein
MQLQSCMQLGPVMSQYLSVSAQLAPNDGKKRQPEANAGQSDGLTVSPWSQLAINDSHPCLNA